MTTSTVFINNRSQAVRLPANLRFPEHIKKVEVIPVGNARLIVPAGELWDSWFDSPERVSDDFMISRDQPAEQERESF